MVSAAAVVDVDGAPVGSVVVGSTVVGSEVVGSEVIGSDVVVPGLGCGMGLADGTLVGRDEG